MEQLLLVTMPKHVKKGEVITDSHNGFTVGKSFLTSLVSFYDGVIAWVVKGRRPVVIYLGLCKAFDPVPHNKLVSKAERGGDEG